jgi:putative addiction module component (TIGR02574 family)
MMLPGWGQQEVSMPTTKEIVEQVESLPVEERALLVDSLLRTLNRSDPGNDSKWAEAARRRLDELRAGRVRPVPGEDVFSKAREQFAR